MKTLKFTQDQLKNLMYIDESGKPVFLSESTSEDFTYVYEDCGTYYAVHLICKSGEMHDSYVLWSSSFNIL